MLSSSTRAFRPLSALSVRHMSAAAGGVAGLKKRLSEILPAQIAEVKELKEKHGDVSLGNVTIDMTYGGMRNVKGLICETSLLDSEEGIRFRGHTVFDCQEKLPKVAGGEEPLPEGLFWLLLTGEVPTAEQVRELSRDLYDRSAIPDDVLSVVDAFPRDLHPMSQLCAGVNVLQKYSIFARRYRDGMGKKDYWDAAFEDSVNVIAKVPRLAARIYTNLYRNGATVQPSADLDWSANFSRMMGYESPDFWEVMRLYLTIHADHEGGNVSAHTTHLVGSALSDPYLSYAAGMNGLAGPLHGLANQEVLHWLFDVQKQIGENPTEQEVEKFMWDTLKAGRVVPGYGHAVLRKTDPRFTCQREYCLKHLPDFPLFKLVNTIYDVAPRVLTQHGKTKNPWPNVDAHSGVLLQYHKFVEQDFYTVLFGVSRGLGVLANLILDRAFGMPLERPKSLTTAWVKEYVKKHHGHGHGHGHNHGHNHGHQ